MTLGCGGWGGNITSDNISPRHLHNIKRLAWETSPAPARSHPAAEGVRAASPPALPRVDTPKPMPGIAAESLARRIDEFLSSRGYAAALPPPPKGVTAPMPAAPAENADTPVPKPKSVEKATEFVCEDDVRLAVRQGRKIVIGERTIVTPAARDLAEQYKVFVQADWRGQS